MTEFLPLYLDDEEVVLIQIVLQKVSPKNGGKFNVLLYIITH